MKVESQARPPSTTGRESLGCAPVVSLGMVFWISWISAYVGLLGFMEPVYADAGTWAGFDRGMHQRRLMLKRWRRSAEPRRRKVDVRSQPSGRLHVSPGVLQRKGTRKQTRGKWQSNACYRHVEEAGQTYDIDPALLAALIHVESRGTPDIVSHAGAIGCAQLMPATARSLGVNPWDPRQNVMGAAKYLDYLRQKLAGRYPRRWGMLPVLAAYNMGPARILRHGGRIPGRGTLRYVRKVVSRYRSHGERTK